MGKNKKPSGVRTGTHSAGGRKRYTDVKRRTTRTPGKRALKEEQTALVPTRERYGRFPGHGGRMGKGVDPYSQADWRRDNRRWDREDAAKANKRKSTTSGRFHSGSAIKNAADVSMNNPPGW